jgi:signal transduction histidine kinase
VSTSLQKFDRNDKTAKFPYLVLAVSILLTVGVTYIFYQSAKTKDSIRFANEVNRLQLTIENKINLYIALLKGGRGFIESNRDITRENFAEYVASLDLGKNYSGVQGIGYAKVISANERAALTEKMKSEGYADFQIFPAEEKEFYQVILYLEPLDERNRKAVGFDMSAEANRQVALERARDSGTAVSSSKVTLVQESEADTQPGFLIYLPIYKNGRLPASVEERRKNITGFIYSPFRADDFIKEIQNGGVSSDVSLKIYDGDVKPENLLMQSDSAQNESSQNQIEENYIAQKELDFAGRKWIVQYSSLPEFAVQSSLGWAPLIFIIGTVFSFLIFGLTYWEASARIKLQATAADLYETEQQKQALLEKEQAARQSAEQANKTKDEFIAVVSHELRTPLNAIGGWTRILKTEDLSENTKKLALEKIEKNLRSQTKLVEDLIDYSQIVSGAIKVEDKEVNFSDVFENTFLEIEPKAQEKSIELYKDNRLNGHFILGDEDKIKIVIHNLLTNAVKFTHSGGKIETAVMENDGTIKMIVKDNGRGISPDFLPHIFDRFTQADASSTRNSGGLGLGLTISNHIIKLHNGRIEAHSEGTGKGSTFTVTVPHYTKLTQDNR